MNYNELKEHWKQEEAYAFKGWDFSHIDGRWKSEELPWDYKEILMSFLKPTDRLLDMGTGGGEFLLSLNHPYHLTSVTESYPPNVALCKKELTPLGITVSQIYDDKLFFVENSFDIVINRHESFDASELRRVLKSGGHFITQQVGGMNDRDLSERLIEDFKPQFPMHTLDNNVKALCKAGFKILMAEEFFTPVHFFDVGALVYFAKIIEWEFPNFSVENTFNRLLKCHEEIKIKGYVQGTENRFIIISQKL